MAKNATLITSSFITISAKVLIHFLPTTNAHSLSSSALSVTHIHKIVALSRVELPFVRSSYVQAATTFVIAPKVMHAYEVIVLNNAHW